MAAAAFSAFLPALHNQLLCWDDAGSLIDNPNYRGLGWTQIKWMFSPAAAMCNGHYIPLTWLTWGLDYVLWGMAPFGYHLSNLLLHGANAVLFFFVSRRLLMLAAPGSAEVEGTGLGIAAAFSAIVFSLHPLRVESVAWAVERKDVLSGLFYLSTVFAYLRSCECDDKAARRRWLCASIAFFALALLSKITGLAIPVVLVVLDIYPLRRLPGVPAQWVSARARPVLLEKIPFLVLSALAAGMGAWLVRRAGGVFSLAEVGIPERFALTVFAPSFYLWKTVVPVHLAPLYERPYPLDVLSWPFLLSGLFVGGFSAIAYRLRQRFPSVLAVWLIYLVMLAPVSGFVTNGPQLAADRYTYLSCLGWAVLGGAGFLQGWRAAGARWKRVFLPAAGALAVVLALLTWRQTGIWHDDERLWGYVLSIYPGSCIAHYNLGVELGKRGEVAEAVKHYKETVRIRPIYAPAHNNLGAALFADGRNAEAVAEYRLALRAAPMLPYVHRNLGVALQRLRATGEAIEQYREAVRLDPSYADARNLLAGAVGGQGRDDEALARLREELRLKPQSSGAHYNLGLALHQRGRTAEAIAEYREALRLKPRNVDARNNLGVALLSTGRAAEAVDQQREALRANPNYPYAHYSLGLALQGLGKTAEAMEQFQQALNLKPGYAEAQFGLGDCLDALKRPAEALTHYQAALRINPGFALARERVARGQRTGP
ncbi:MAG: tetratricopeptide repeat protein [Elusimicrobia bacterium]|nr:tetratricopeptide repeat protein [Elusimicrobiota bacterium]